MLGREDLVITFITSTLAPLTSIHMPSFQFCFNSGPFPSVTCLRNSVYPAPHCEKLSYLLWLGSVYFYGHWLCRVWDVVGKQFEAECGFVIWFLQTVRLMAGSWMPCSMWYLIHSEPEKINAKCRASSMYSTSLKFLKISFSLRITHYFYNCHQFYLSRNPVLVS